MINVNDRSVHSLMRLIVIGGGAAGFFCAVNAARMNPGLQVIVVEKTGRLLSKVRVSGGGRCNVTHACFSIAEMSKKYPRGANFVKKTFHEFFTGDTIEWFRERGLELKTEADGRMFPVTDSSESVIRVLLNEVDRYRVEVRLHHDVVQIERRGEGWIVHFGNGRKEQADFLCVACGGYPKSTMFRWLEETGHTIEQPVPSLFTFNMPGNPVTRLMGISVDGRVKIQGTSLEEEGPVLITHWGLSGPAILRLSARGARHLYDVNYRFSITVNWSKGWNENTFREKAAEWRTEAGSRKVTGKNPYDLPQRLWEFLCGEAGIAEEVRWAELTSLQLNRLAKLVCASEMKVEGKTTFKEEFVTAGGIRLTEVDHATMQSRVVPRLFFAGEVLDVDGITGGFNFQHAWTSGWIAARSIAGMAVAPPSDGKVKS